MAQEIDKIIKSTTTPKSKDVLWDNGKELLINRNGKWESTGGDAPMINITYANLVKLRNNSKLIAGMQYRITDYVTTTAQENTRSAGHQFDVIVTADNENTLNEVARACKSEFDIEKYKDAYSGSWCEKMLYIGTQEYEGKECHLYESESHDLQMLVDFSHPLKTHTAIDESYPFIYYPSYTREFDGSDWGMWEDGRDYSEVIQFKYEDPSYFDSCKLEAWKLWYSLDNNIKRFSWADAENGKGVIYRMIDEWNNDCPYDFKNIIYVFAFSFECTQYGMSHTYTKSSQVISLDGVDYYGYARTRTGNGPPPPPELLYSSELIPSTSMKLYQILDGVASEYTSATIDSVETKEGGVYTFQGNGKDATLTTECHSNIIGAYINNGVRILNDIYFVSENSSLVCYSNSFGNNCHDNSFGNNCYNNSFGNNCYSNSFGNYCHDNNFGNSCYSNSFGESCHRNSSGNDFHSNSFGDACSSNSFGNYFHSNSFGDACYSNSFGNYCHDNNFGNSCYSNSFGDDCDYNSFGNSSQSNELKAYYRYITFGEGVQYVTLQNETEGNYENQVQNYRVANGTHGEDGNPLVVDVTRNIGCETFIGMDSNDELKVFCLADLLNQ